jgi:hypothetical protein
MLGVDLLVAVLDSDGLRSTDSLLELFGKSVEVHGVTQLSRYNLSVLLSTDISIPS